MQINHRERMLLETAKLALEYLTVTDFLKTTFKPTFWEEAEF